MPRRLARSALGAIAGLAGLGGCGGVEPIPLRGPRPHSILVAPPLDEHGLLERSAADRLAHVCGAALRGLGYRVATPERWWPVIGEAGLLPQEGLLPQGGLSPQGGLEPGGLAELGRVAHVDALLTVRVHRWDVMGASAVERLDYDFDYELWSTALGIRQWSHRVTGVYERPASVVGAQEFGLVEDGPATTPVAGGGGAAFRGVDDALAAVQRWAMARLPARE